MLLTLKFLLNALVFQGVFSTLDKLESVPTPCDLWELLTFQLLQHSLPAFMDFHPRYAQFLFWQHTQGDPLQISGMFLLHSCLFWSNQLWKFWVFFLKPDLSFLNLANTSYSAWAPFLCTSRVTWNLVQVESYLFVSPFLRITDLCPLA